MRGWGIVGSGIVALWIAAVLLALVPAAGALQGTPTPPPVVFFQDDFATYSHRWLESESPKASVAYRSGALNLRVVSPGVGVWSVPDFDTALDNYRIETTVTVNGGSADSVIGFVLASQGNDRFYALGATVPGDWRLLFYENGAWTDLTPGTKTAARSTRNTDDMPFVLRADVTGETLALWINDRPGGQVRLDEPMHGGVFGLFARAGRGYIDVSFDDVTVTELTEDDES